MRAGLIALTVLLAACGAPAVTGPTPIPGDEAGPVSTPIPVATPAPLACTPIDQDQYVYHPDRLEVLSACLRVTGTVVRLLHEADGDDHIRVEPDAAYTNLLTAANVNQAGCRAGCLVIEPICEHTVTQADAIALCAADGDPLRGLPQPGQHVWFEGRYVLDLQHGGWAELHPLYRWGAD